MFVIYTEKPAVLDAMSLKILDTLVVSAYQNEFFFLNMCTTVCTYADCLLELGPCFVSGVFYKPNFLFKKINAPFRYGQHLYADQ